MEQIVGLVVVAICLLALPLVLGLAVVYGVRGRERRRQMKVFAETQRINAMLKDGRITEREANDLKDAIGAKEGGELVLPPDKHVKIICLCYNFFGCVGFAFACVFLGLFIHMTPGESAHLGLGFVASFLVVSVMLLVFSSFLRRGRAWARYCVIVVSVMNLFSVPIGTALGIYSLWALLLRDRAADYFD